MDSLFLGLTIGATIAGGFEASIGRASASVKRLDNQTKQLTARQERYGNTIAQSIGRPYASLSKLHQKYKQIGNAIERNITAQKNFNKATEAQKWVDTTKDSMRSGMVNEGAKLAVIGAGIKSTVGQAAAFKDQINDLAITGEWTQTEQDRIGGLVRQSALTYNQTTSDINEGLGTLVAGGISTTKELEAFAPKMTRIATAWRTSFEDVGNTALALNNNLDIGAAGFDRAMNMLGYAGKAGQFEADDMAKWLPSLTPFYQALGVQGEGAVAEIGASLQIARMGAGSSDEAANNMRNFMAKLTAPDTLRDFDKAGINLQASMQSMVKNGMTPMQAMFTNIENYIGTKSPAAVAEFNKAMTIKDDKERQMAVSRLEETYKLGELFQDQQALSFIRPMLANKQQFESIKAGSFAAADQDVVGADFLKRMQSPTEQFKSFKLVVLDMAITLGNVFMPVLLDTAQAVKPMVMGFAKFAQQHPKLISGVVGFAAGFIALKFALFTVGFVALSILSPFTRLYALFRHVQAIRAYAQGLFLLGRAAPKVLKLGGGLLKLGRIMRVVGLMFMTNPILIAVVAIAGAAYLIYRNWDKLKPYFLGLWAKLKAFANSGVGNILKTLAGFTPLGLFVRAWSFVFSYFAGLVPKFRGFGINIIQGLIGGITAKFGALKSKISNLASSTAGWFKSKLGIQSPSRVFIDFGANIAEGVAIGIGQQTPTAVKASDEMAKRLAQTQYSNQVLGSQSISGGMSAGTIHFSPNINVTVGADTGDVSSQVHQGLSASFEQFERMLEQVEYNRQRRAFA